MAPEPTTFGFLIRSRREARELSLRQMEAETGVSNAYLSQIESGRVGAPSPKIIERLASALGFEYLELMEAAGHLGALATAPTGGYLRLSDRTVPLDDLTDADRARLLQFVRRLKAGRAGGGENEGASGSAA